MADSISDDTEIHGNTPGRARCRGLRALLFSALAIGFSAFYFYAAGPDFLGRIDTGLYRGLFLLLALVMVFMLYPARSSDTQARPGLIDLLLIAATLVSYGYFIWFFDDLVRRVGYFTTADVVMASLAIVTSLEATRRVAGLALPGLAAAFLLYGVYGNLLPQNISHRGYAWDRVVTDMFKLDAMFGLVLNVTATYVVLFVVFGALMSRFGAGDFFVRLPYALTAGFRGGPAKASVVASGLMGMISGSATANTMATGTFTIPLMIKAGYRRHVAGAIEPAASTGGMFMPPIMGAGVFIMAEMIRVPYTEIMLIGLAPALLYFFSVGTIAHFEALREDIPVIAREHRESAWEILKDGWYHALPIVFVIWLMLDGMSPSRAVFWAIVLFVAISTLARILKRPTGEGIATTLAGVARDIILALREGTINALSLSAIVGTVGIILGIVFLTGLGFIFTTSVMQFTFGFLPLGILLALFASYVLGMGMTVTSAYILMAILVAPALETMGVPILAAHMLVFWYSQSSNISPPVCIAAFAGASIAKSDPMKTGFTALKYSAFLFVLPILFVYTPILMPNGATWDAWRAIVTAFIAIPATAAAFIGYLVVKTNWLERIALLLGAAALLAPQIWLNVAGLVVLAGVWWLQRRQANSATMSQELDRGVQETGS